jgi:hypothetical protein
MDQLCGFQWKDEEGVAHIYEKRLVHASGNLLNVRIPQFLFPMMWVTSCTFSALVSVQSFKGTGAGEALTLDSNFRNSNRVDYRLGKPSKTQLQGTSSWRPSRQMADSTS